MVIQMLMKKEKSNEDDQRGRIKRCGKTAQKDSCNYDL